MLAPVQADPIEIRVDDVAQLFNTLDPFPFREKDLDREAEEYIVSWARELPRDTPLRTIVHHQDSADQSAAARELDQALSRYFAYRAKFFAASSKSSFASVADRLPSARPC